VQSNSIISKLSEALSDIKRLSFREHSASQVTKAMILIEMAIHYLEDSRKEDAQKD
jgi:hypothetical protein